MKHGSIFVGMLLVSCALMAQDYELRVLTFEDTDVADLESVTGAQTWSQLIDNPQYSGTLLYGSYGMGEDTLMYDWYDKGNTELYSMLPFNWGSFCFWAGGHAVSHYVSGQASNYGTYNHQLTVYKSGVTGMQTTGGGHNGSDNFCIHYGYRDNSGYSASELPILMFNDYEPRVIDHMYVTNTCYAINCYLEGNGLTSKIGPEDWVKIVATGYDADMEPSKTAEFYLCNGPEHIIRDWTKWDLSSLGPVMMVEFNITGSSDNGFGFSQPAYFAYDDVAVRFAKGSPTSINSCTNTTTSRKIMRNGQLYILRDGKHYNAQGQLIY